MLSRQGCFNKALSLFVLLSLNLAKAEDATCPWIATYGKSATEIAEEVYKRTGKRPTSSCGGGSEFKVCSSCTDRLTPEQWRKIQTMLADPSYRSWHTTWHSNVYDRAKKLQQEKGGRLEDIVGESFFFAHREIYRSVQANLAAMNLPCILPWVKLPSQANDETWPDDAALNIKRLKETCEAGVKADLTNVSKFQAEWIFFLRDHHRSLQEALTKVQKQFPNQAEHFKEREALFEKSQVRQMSVKKQLMEKLKLTDEKIVKYGLCDGMNTIENANQAQKSLAEIVAKNSDKDYLKKHSLGQVGKDINNEWHGSLHFAYGIDSKPECHEQSVDIACQSMASAYSSHVNIHFYKVHGLIDQHIERWLATNGYDYASSNCGSAPRCYQWKGVYAGEPPDFVMGKGCNIKKGLEEKTLPAAGFR